MYTSSIQKRKARLEVDANKYCAPSEQVCSLLFLFVYISLLLIDFPPLSRWTHLAVTYSAVRREASVYKDGEFAISLPVQGQLEANGKNLAIRMSYPLSSSPLK